MQSAVANYIDGTGRHTGLLRWLGCLSGGTHTPGSVLHTETAGRWGVCSRVHVLWPEVGHGRVKKHSSKFFKSEKHWGVVTFNVYCEFGYNRVKAVAAFFLIWGYFSTHQVFFTPWGVTKYKKCFL